MKFTIFFRNKSFQVFSPTNSAVLRRNMMPESTCVFLTIPHCITLIFSILSKFTQNSPAPHNIQYSMQYERIISLLSCLKTFFIPESVMAWWFYFIQHAENTMEIYNIAEPPVPAIFRQHNLVILVIPLYFYLITQRKRTIHHPMTLFI